MNNRPKISSLDEKALATLLQESFFKAGRYLKLEAYETKIFLDEIYKNQGRIYVDTFSEAFSKYAACELPEVENLRPQISPLFVSKLMKSYFKKCNENKFIAKSVKDNSSHLTGEEKYQLFLKHVTFNKLLPANPDWVSIYEYLGELKKFTLIAEWELFNYTKKLKYAMAAVSEWTYKNFTIRDKE